MESQISYAIVNAGTLLSLADVLLLFSNTVWGQNANLEFLKKHIGATFEKRSRPWRATINPDDVHSGDFLALSKIRGRWGGFETLEKWVTSAFAGHTAVCLKDEFSNLWVGESGHENEKGEEIIVVIPWDEWWELSLKDQSNPQVVISVISMWTRVQSAYAANMWNEALNKHLGTEVLFLFLNAKNCCAMTQNPFIFLNTPTLHHPVA
ncbi:hypothetical protein LOK49_LG05G02226 [Camellia lanceoleosa]|uniref:Uncharacterized protein n=1 Tax=Camellia lanceoleosa TaxID=1840588 RepID=A0ACC0HUD8_9ERIC|nr:hypothetical protein LOK49_LG05G02226 [Camellia lanceoleosa]